VRIEEREAHKNLLMLWKGEKDSWVSHLTPPYGMSRVVSEKLVRVWLQRLKQSLQDSGGGEISAIITEVEKPLVSKGTDFHYHVLLRGDGLDKLDKSKAEQRWHDITGREVTVMENPKLTVTYIPSVLRKRDGEVTVLSKEKRVHVEFSEHKEIRGGGSCRISPTDDGAPYYIASKKNLSNTDQLAVWGRIPE
jgi:hypothetical protein